MRHDSDTTKIKTIRIPARLNRDLRMSSLMRMADTGSVKQIEFLIWNLEQSAT